MANELNTQPAESGNYVDSEGNVVNLVDLLLVDSDQPVTYDSTTALNILKRTAPKSGNMVASDGRVFNLVDLIKGNEPIVTTNTTKGGYSIPDLTPEQIVDIYNRVVKGRHVVIQDSKDVYYTVSQVDSINDTLQVQISYFDTMIITYLLEGDHITIEALKLSTSKVTE